MSCWRSQSRSARCTQKCPRQIPKKFQLPRRVASPHRFNKKERPRVVESETAAKIRNDNACPEKKRVVRAMRLLVLHNLAECSVGPRWSNHIHNSYLYWTERIRFLSPPCLLVGRTASPRLVSAPHPNNICLLLLPSLSRLCPRHHFFRLRQGFFLQSGARPDTQQQRATPRPPRARASAALHSTPPVLNQADKERRPRLAAAASFCLCRRPLLWRSFAPQSAVALSGGTLLLTPEHAGGGRRRHRRRASSVCPRRGVARSYLTAKGAARDRWRDSRRSHARGAGGAAPTPSARSLSGPPTERWRDGGYSERDPLALLAVAVAV